MLAAREALARIKIYIFELADISFVCYNKLLVILSVRAGKI